MKRAAIGPALPPRGTSALRDDVDDIIASLTALFFEKQRIIERLLLGETALAQGLRTSQTERIADLHENVDRDIAAVNVVDYEIGGRLDGLAAMFGIDRMEALRRVLAIDTPRTRSLAAAIAAALTMMNDLMEKRRAVVDLFDHELAEMHQQIQELSMLHEVKSRMSGVPTDR